jgi:hypothetical protein
MIKHFMLILIVLFAVVGGLKADMGTFDNGDITFPNIYPANIEINEWVYIIDGLTTGGAPPSEWEFSCGNKKVTCTEGEVSIK